MGILVFPALMRRRSSDDGMLYDYGTEHVSWVQGYSTENTDGQYYEASSYIELWAEDGENNEAELATVTDSKVDLTGVSTVRFYVDRRNSTNNNRHRYFIVSSSKTGNYSVYNAREYVQGGIGYTTVDLDVSGLSGEYYVRVHSRTTSKLNECITRVYQVSLL